MLEALKFKGQVTKSAANLRANLRDGVAAIDLDQARRWLPVTGLLVIAGCSWFSDNSTPAPDANPAEQTSEGKATTPAPGEGETMENGTASTGSATSPGTQTADAGTADAAKATFPDINSVPNEAPKSSIVNLDQTPSGLGADTANAQHTDDTLTMPNESAARPEKPGAEEGQVATVEPTAPETPPEAPAVTPEAATPTPEATPAPEATAPAPEATPTAEPAPAPAPVQVAIAGTPQPGATPFEPSGPLYLTPGSLARNAHEAPTATATQTAVATATPIAPMPAAPTEIAAVPTPAPTPPTPTPITATPMPGSAPSGEAVSVDYSALDGLQGGGQSMAPSPAPLTPMMTANTAQIAGVGQAVGYVYFGNGSSQLSSSDRQVLQQVVELQRIQGGVLRIIGHASQRTGNMDALEQQQVNRRVSLQRATVVAQALVGLGVQPLLVQVAAAGDDQTLYAESTPAGEAGNRRAEVYLSQN